MTHTQAVNSNRADLGLIGNFFNITPYIAAVRPAFSAAHAGNMRDMVLLFRFPYAVEQAQWFLILGVLDYFSFHHNSFRSFSLILPLRFKFHFAHSPAAEITSTRRLQETQSVIAVYCKRTRSHKEIGGFAASDRRKQTHLLNLLTKKELQDRKESGPCGSFRGSASEISVIKEYRRTGLRSIQISYDSINILQTFMIFFEISTFF